MLKITELYDYVNFLKFSEVFINMYEEAGFFVLCAYFKTQG